MGPLGIDQIFNLPCRGQNFPFVLGEDEELAPKNGSRSEPSRHGGQAMTRVVFTANIQRHVGCPEAHVSGRTVREVLEAVFADNPEARGYVLDDQSALRKHMTVFVDGHSIRDRVCLSDTVTEASTIHVFQALSGG
jgi:sulfur-carrier protein